MPLLLRSTIEDTLNEARDLRRAGDPVAAFALIEDLFSPSNSREDEARLFVEAGLCNKVLRQYDAAHDAFSAGVRIDPDNLKARTLLGTSFRYKGNYEQALVHFRHVLQVKPNDSFVRQALKQMNLQPQAKPFAMAVDARELVNHSLRLRKLGRVEDALDLLHRDMESFTAGKDISRIAVALGDCHFALQQRPEAVAAYTVALEKDPENIFALVALGKLFRYDRKFSQARHYLEAALKQEPDNPFAMLHLAKTAEYQGFTAESHDLFQRLVKLCDGHPARRSMLLDCQAHLSRLEFVEPGHRTLEEHAREPKIATIVEQPPPRITTAEPALSFTSGPSPEELVESFRAAGLKAKGPSQRQVASAKLHAHDAETRLPELPRELSAAEKFAARIAQNPRDVGAHFSLAGLLRREGDIAGAITHYEAVLGVDKLNSDAAKALRQLKQS